MSVSFSVSLARTAIAASQARALVRDRLGDQMPATTLHDVLLAVSELVTNAVLHGEGEIEIRVELDGVAVKCEVIDEGRGFEHELREDGVKRVGGRGLKIVGQLAESWGVHEGTTHVWFQIPLVGSSDERDRPELGHPGEDQLPDV